MAKKPEPGPQMTDETVRPAGRRQNAGQAKPDGEQKASAKPKSDGKQSSESGNRRSADNRPGDWGGIYIANLNIRNTTPRNSGGGARNASEGDAPAPQPAPQPLPPPQMPPVQPPAPPAPTPVPAPTPPARDCQDARLPNGRIRVRSDINGPLYDERVILDPVWNRVKNYLSTMMGIIFLLLIVLGFYHFAKGFNWGAVFGGAGQTTNQSSAGASSGATAEASGVRASSSSTAGAAPASAVATATVQVVQPPPPPPSGPCENLSPTDRARCEIWVLRK